MPLGIAPLSSVRRDGAMPSGIAPYACWVKMGPEGAALCLNTGANDLGGTLLTESISRAAGTQHGQEFPPEEMERVIASIGRVPRQRSTTYGPVPQKRQAASFVAAELAPVVQTPVRKLAVAE